LASGALKVSDGQAIAWCEMARGLLLHWVQLDAEGRVADYRVLAPTEWNFHPQGVLAKALATLAPNDTASASALAAAFDACVECQVSAADALMENTHA
jgi:Ni,Fe-hydrogenase I large subunit